MGVFPNQGWVTNRPIGMQTFFSRYGLTNPESTLDDEHITWKWYPLLLEGKLTLPFGTMPSTSTMVSVFVRVE